MKHRSEARGSETIVRCTKGLFLLTGSIIFGESPLPFLSGWARDSLSLPRGRLVEKQKTVPVDGLLRS